MVVTFLYTPPWAARPAGGCEPGRVDPTSRQIAPKAFPAYLFVETRKVGATNPLDPVISSWRPESSEKLLNGTGRYFLRIVTDGSDWQIEVQQRAK